MAQTKVTTAEIKPTVINFKDTNTADFATTSTTYVDVTGSVFSYTSGPVAEKNIRYSKCHVSSNYWWKWFCQDYG